jgi:hypothetical protein
VPLVQTAALRANPAVRVISGYGMAVWRASSACWPPSLIHEPDEPRHGGSTVLPISGIPVFADYRITAKTAALRRRAPRTTAPVARNDRVPLISKIKSLYRTAHPVTFQDPSPAKAHAAPAPSPPIRPSGQTGHTPPPCREPERASSRGTRAGLLRGTQAGLLRGTQAGKIRASQAAASSCQRRISSAVWSAACPSAVAIGVNSFHPGFMVP